MFGVLSALGQFGNAGMQSFEDNLAKMALARAFMPDQPDQPDQPMAPPPGQASMPQQRPMPAPGTPMPQARPQAAGPPAQQPPPPQMAQTPQGMMPQLDLQTLMGRIQARTPNLPPQVMLAALNQAAPLLNQQAKYDLMLMQQQNRQDMLGLREQGLRDRMQMFNIAEGRRQQDSEFRRAGGGKDPEAEAERLRIRGEEADLRRRQLDQREKGLPLREKEIEQRGVRPVGKTRARGSAAANTPPVESLKEGMVTTFANGQQWTLQGGKPVQVGSGGVTQ